MVAEPEDIRERVFDLRYDPDTRKVSGVAIKYGDVAVLPWGKERIEPGAFGELGNADIILDVNHVRDKCVARTNGGGLTLRDSAFDLRVEAELADTTDGNDALVLVEKKILRGLSVAFRSKTVSIMDDTEVIEKAKLVRIGIVDTPAYAKSTVMRERARREENAMPDASTDAPSTKVDLTPESLADALRSVLQEGQAAGAAEDDADAMVERMAAAVTPAIETALKARDDAEAKRAEAEEAKVAAEKEAVAERAKVEDGAEKRAELLVMLAPLLPDEFSARGQSNKEIMIAAAGDEIEDAGERSEDYLLAKLEAILERRAAAANQQTTGGGGAPSTRAAPAPRTGGVNIIRLIERRGAAKEAS